MKIIDLLKNSAAAKPHNIALKNQTHQLRYWQMLWDIEDLSGKLKSVGCGPGVKVAIILDNSIEYFISFFAISAAQGTILPLSAKMKTYETAKYIAKADVSIVITNQKYARQLLKTFDNSNKIAVVHVQYDSEGKLESRTIISARPRIDAKNKDVALMVYTSGTTRPSKIVMSTDSQLISNMTTYRSLMQFDSHNIIYCSLMLHHIYTICAQILTHISLADTFIISSKPFFIKDFLSAVESQKVTITAFVPYMAMLLAEFPQAENNFDLHTLKYITLSGAKTPKSTYIQLTERYNHVQFINTYGMSEAGSRISIAAPFPTRFPPDSVGKPMPGVQVKIVDDSGNTLPPEAAGEVEVKSSGVMKGYYKQPQLTSETLRDGWLRTGDIGKLDHKGNLFLVGRKKDIIVSGGDNIYPLEIEQCLLDHPGILEAAVIPQHDGILQEVPCAFIVHRPSDMPTATDIIRFCRQRLSSHKVPRSIIFLKQLPKLATSKVDRHKLKKMAVNSP